MFPKNKSLRTRKFRPIKYGDNARRIHEFRQRNSNSHSEKAQTNWLEVAGTGSVIVTGFVYGSGFFYQMVLLRQLGVGLSELSVKNGQVLFSGLRAIALSIYLPAIFLAGTLIIRVMPNIRRWFVVMIGLPLAVCAVWRIFSLTDVTVFGLELCVTSVMVLALSGQRPISPIRVNPRISQFGLAIAIVFMFFYTAYSLGLKDAEPNRVPFHRIQLSVDSSIVPLLKGNGIKFLGESQTSCPLNLIYANDGNFFVSAAGSSVVEIPRSKASPLIWGSTPQAYGISCK